MLRWTSFQATESLDERYHEKQNLPVITKQISPKFKIPLY